MPVPPPPSPAASEGPGPLSAHSAVTIASAVRAGAVRAVDVVADALARIERVDPALSAFAEVWDERARAWAEAVDARIAAGERPPLAGVPIGVKGRGGLRTAAPLLAAGCVPVGATSVPGPGTPWQTWGAGRYGRTVNPWRRDRTPGGSSAGSAAAVAAGLVPLATGNDGAGSVRIPAAWCGVLGLKATNGRFPTTDATGLMAPGVLTRSVADAAAYWAAVSSAPATPQPAPSAPAAGAVAPGDPATPQPSPSAPAAALWSPDLGFASPDPEVVAVAHAAAVRLHGAGVVRLVDVGEPFRLDDPAPAWLALRGSAAGPPPEAARRLRAANDRRLAALFRRTRLLLTPTAPTPPHGHDGPGERFSTALTWAFNLSGHPAISVPAGFGPDGCPVGLQLVAEHGQEAALLSMAEAAEGLLGPWTPATCIRI
ncbi:amidase [Streptomyces sp. KAU_LT]|uniref:amidase n=1 Tax=Streptomyces sp. KAU_LT TaxID=3046669 RepID=UPI0024B77B5C|nr:amidase [Streptomyces sp. KAU_LT]MDI9831861.1 amidase [Streptomyces sp. KAU_LT]